MLADAEAIAAWKLELARRLRLSVGQRDPVADATERRELDRLAILPNGDAWAKQALDHEREHLGTTRPDKATLVAQGRRHYLGCPLSGDRP